MDGLQIIIFLYKTLIPFQVTVYLNTQFFLHPLKSRTKTFPCIFSWSFTPPIAQTSCLPAWLPALHFVLIMSQILLKTLSVKAIQLLSSSLSWLWHIAVTLKISLVSPVDSQSWFYALWLYLSNTLITVLSLLRSFPPSHFSLPPRGSNSEMWHFVNS